MLKVDNKTVRESQIGKLQRLKGERDPAAVAAAALERSPMRRARARGNLLELAVTAARAKATVGEISRCAGEGVRPPSRRDPRRVGRLHGGGREP